MYLVPGGLVFRSALTFFLGDLRVGDKMCVVLVTPLLGESRTLFFNGFLGDNKPLPADFRGENRPLADFLGGVNLLPTDFRGDLLGDKVEGLI